MTHRHRRASRQTHGFSLIELLVVLAIIALLIGILIPTLMRARSTSQTANCGANLKQIGAAMEMYANDNRNWYPRALPLAPGADRFVKEDWQIPWPADQCPTHWAMGYPGQILSYMGWEVVDPFDYSGFMDPRSKNYIPRPEESPRPAEYFDSPSNEIPTTDLNARKCGYPVDYGMTNWASQESAPRIDANTAYLAGDQTWGLSYVADSGGPNVEEDLDGWWVPFIHTESTAHILRIDQSIELINKGDFITRFTEEPPDDEL